METGFNIVEVPGSKSRKVAGKKQQWYRTAILKMFLEYGNILHFSALLKNNTTKFNISETKLFPGLYVKLGIGTILISLTDSKMKSVFNFKLHKTVRFFLSGNFDLLIKSHFLRTYNVWETDLFNTEVWGRGSDKFKKQIKWLSI